MAGSDASANIAHVDSAVSWHSSSSDEDAEEEWGEEGAGSDNQGEHMARHAATYAAHARIGTQPPSLNQYLQRVCDSSAHGRGADGGGGDERDDGGRATELSAAAMHSGEAERREARVHLAMRSALRARGRRAEGAAAPSSGLPPWEKPPSTEGRLVNGGVRLAARRFEECCEFALAIAFPQGELKRLQVLARKAAHGHLEPRLRDAVHQTDLA